jgi:hypothetical protein
MRNKATSHLPTDEFSSIPLWNSHATRDTQNQEKTPMTTTSKSTRFNTFSGGRVYLLIAILIITIPLAAKATTFTIDPNQSTLVLSGSLSGSAIQQQGAGSLSTAYSGSIDAFFNATQIMFNNANVDALVSGTWQPGLSGTTGSAAADYGAKATVVIFTGVGAVRDFTFNISSGLLPRTGSAFDASQLTLSTTAGSFDYNVPSVKSGSQTLTGQSALDQLTAGMITQSGNVETLTIPISYTQTFTLLSANDSTLTVTGNLVAIAAVPESSSVSLLLCGGVLLIAMSARRRWKAVHPRS